MQNYKKLRFSAIDAINKITTLGVNDDIYKLQLSYLPIRNVFINFAPSNLKRWRQHFKCGKT